MNTVGHWRSVVAFCIVAASQPSAGQPGAPDSGARFIAQADIVVDRLTGLSWQRCSLGQRWDADLGCVGIAKKVWFAEARQLESAAWRLPSLAELRTLYGADLVSISDTTAFPDAPDTGYWALGDREEAAVWGVSCDESRADSCYRGDARAVRLIVRRPEGGLPKK